MKGLELSRKYFEQYGQPMLSENFSHILPYLAAGFVGSGSDRFGFDDEISGDHDFEPGFCIFIPGEDIIDRKTAFQLERAYAKLPKEFEGYKRQMMSPVGGNRNGVIRISDFYERAVGSPGGKLSTAAWLSIPEYALAEATNGDVFFDNYGKFSEIRESLLDMPRDIRIKKLAGNILLMAQAGQYNYVRCLNHGEIEASQMACTEFAKAAVNAYMLICERYMPYYKWSFRALRELPGGKKLADKLSNLLWGNNNDENTASMKQFLIEEIASDFIEILQDEKLTEAACGDLEKHAYSVNDRITDNEIRNMNILAGI